MLLRLKVCFLRRRRVRSVDSSTMFQMLVQIVRIVRIVRIAQLTRSCALAVLVAALVGAATASPARAMGVVVSSPSNGLSSGPATTAGFKPPARVLPGRLLLRHAQIDEELLRRADAGEAQARRRVERIVRALRVPHAQALHFERGTVAGYALFTWPTDDEAETLLLVKRLRSHAGVLGAAANHWWQPLKVPNDLFIEQMWHLTPIGAFGAWDLTVGDSSQTVAVIDTGTFRSHEDLVGKDAAGFDFVSTENSADGDARDPDYEDPGVDCEGNLGEFHGTHVAGTILAAANNGLGIAGLNWSARLVTVRALGCFGGSNLDILEGLAWLAGFDIALDPETPSGDKVPALPPELRPRVVNMSLGSEGECDDFSRDVLNLVVEQGLIAVVAAGNDSGPVNNPANCEAAIAVAAYGPGTDNPIAGYSSFGSQIDVVAPGGDQSARGDITDGVLSLYSAASDPPYAYLQGTSMAAPHVAGAISLMLALNSALGRAQVVSILERTGDACQGCGDKPALRIDRALVDVGGIDPTEPGDPCATLCSPGQACVDNLCVATCGSDDDCAQEDLCTDDGLCRPDDGDHLDNGNGNGAIRLCDPRRGNMDCPSGEGCVANEDRRTGVCALGHDGGADVGALCGSAQDCETGLCDRGVCTVSCDEGDGCHEGFSCDDNAVPGGLCRAESCRLRDDDFCGAGWACNFSSTEHYVCAHRPSNYPGCAQASLDGRTALVLGLLWILRFRRRR